MRTHICIEWSLGENVKYILVHRFCRPLLDIPGCSHKNGCFGWVYGRAQLKPIGKTSSAPQWVGACAPRRRPPHPQARWNYFCYLLSSLLLLIHKSISEAPRPRLPAPHRRSHQTPQQCLRMARTEWTLGSLAFSNRSRNQSQFGVQSPSSKAIDRQTLVVEGEGKQCRKGRSRRETLTQGLETSVLYKILKRIRFRFFFKPKPKPKPVWVGCTCGKRKRQTDEKEESSSNTRYVPSSREHFDSSPPDSLACSSQSRSPGQWAGPTVEAAATPARAIRAAAVLLIITSSRVVLQQFRATATIRAAVEAAAGAFTYLKSTFAWFENNQTITLHVLWTNYFQKYTHWDNLQYNGS